MTDRHHRRRRIALAVVLFAAFPAAWLLRAHLAGIQFTVCPYRALTGRRCAFCGLTRAFAHAAHGELAAAHAAHPLWWLAAAALAALGLLALHDGLSGSDRVGRLFRAWLAHAWYTVAILCAAAALRW